MSLDKSTRIYTAIPLDPFEPTIGRWLWQLEDTRRETLETIADMNPLHLDWQISPTTNSIGSLLYHIALIELDWLYTEVLDNTVWPEELQKLFPWPARDADDLFLTHITGESLPNHLHRLERVRFYLLATFQEMTLPQFRQLHTFPDYDVTPEWVLHHLIQHEAEHRGHIQMLRTLAEQRL